MRSPRRCGRPTNGPPASGPRWVWGPVAQAQQRLRRALADLRGRPADPVSGEFVLADEKAKSAPWTRPARAVGLPVRFLVVTVSSGQITHVVAGNPVPAELTLGLDPTGVEEPPHVDEHGRLVAGDSLRWLVDYDTALAVGMAVNVPITQAEAEHGFDQVFVLGIRAGDPAVTAARLSDLLDGHHYTAGGLSLLPNGTPTNNTDAATSGYGRREDAAGSFDIERRAPLAAELPVPTDGWRLARALGLSADTFAHVAHADGQDIADAQLANAVLWPATAGYAVEELLGRVISLPTRDLLRLFATTYVVGRGTLPALRVGHQPYGVLPTTAFAYFEPIGLPTDPGRRFEELLRDVLLTARKDWAAQVPRLAHAYSNQPADRRQRVLNVLGLDATARGHRQHYAVNGAWAGATLHVGVPADAEHTVVRQGAFAVVQRFAEAIAKARRLHGRADRGGRRGHARLPALLRGVGPVTPVRDAVPRPRSGHSTAQPDRGSGRRGRGAAQVRPR